MTSPSPLERQISTTFAGGATQWCIFVSAIPQPGSASRKNDRRRRDRCCKKSRLVIQEAQKHGITVNELIDNLTHDELDMLHATEAMEVGQRP
jgi:hypothetical protein